MSAIAKALEALPSGAYVLAVSGGRDSMVLLHAFARSRRDDLSAVATFDHGSGAAATAAAELVIHTCMASGIPVVAGRDAGTARGCAAAGDRFDDPPAAKARPSEASWREARWAFLRAVALERQATVVTAHTLDDQAETVAMRILRDASARGLAAMAWPTDGVARPLLALRRAKLAAYAAEHRVEYRDDPSNADPRHLRNRLRAGVLAPIEEVRPGFAQELFATSLRAAEWRADLAALVDGLGVRLVGEVAVVEADSLVDLPVEGLRVVWPEIAGRASVVLDWRGVQRLANWTARAVSGQRIPLSGGALVERTTHTFVVRRAAAGDAAAADEAR